MVPEISAPRAWKKLVSAGVVACIGMGVLWPREASPHRPVTTVLRFNSDIAPILNSKCAQCHAPGSMAMPLQTWDETRPWAQAIKEEILSKHMPPWPAERGYGAFANDGALTPRQIEFLMTWIDGGAPMGDGDPAPYIDHRPHWMMGQPTHIAAPVPGTRPAAVEDGFTRLELDPKIAADTWVRGFDFKTDDPMLRAAFFTVIDTGQYIGGWTPWSTSVKLPEGIGIKVPARSRIAVDLLRGPAAPKPGLRAELGLYVPDGPVRAATDIVLKPDVAHARESSGRVWTEYALPAAHRLLGVRVQMSGAGRSIELRARRPDGWTEPLLWIRKFSQDWQAPYVFRRPVALPAGSVIQAATYFDSSEAAPKATVIISADDAPARR
jgi:hypothetical protein